MKQHLDQLVFQRFHDKLVRKTNNFGNITWLGQPVWQNVLDLWTIQETLFEVKPDLLIECGTNRAGSAMFYAQLFDLMGKGRVITVDVEKLHSCTHPRVEFLLGSSVAEPILQVMRQRVAASPGPVMVIARQRPLDEARPCGTGGLRRGRLGGQLLHGAGRGD